MRERRQLFVVGEDFGRSAQRYHHDIYALTGASGRRLARLSGLVDLEFYVRTRRTNVVELPEQWRDRDLVQAGVDRVREMVQGGRVLLLGARVAVAFDVVQYDLFRWYTLWGDTRVARMPHPSGRSRFWNDPASVEVAREFLTRALIDQPWATSWTP